MYYGELNYIEDQIMLYSDSADEKDIVRCQAYLELRKKLLDELFINNLEKHLTELVDFNERMTAALRTLWDDAHKCLATCQNMKGFDIEVRAYLELEMKDGNSEDVCHKIFCLLSDPTYNPMYHSGVCISPLILRRETTNKSFDEFIGNDGKSWNEGLPEDLTSHIPLTMMFHHLFDHTFWSLSDMVKIQHFNIVLNTTLEKQHNVKTPEIIAIV